MVHQTTRLSVSVLFAAAITIPALIAAFAPEAKPSAAATPVAVPELVEVPAGSFRYRAAGEFRRGGELVTAPLLTVTFAQPLLVMRHQVTNAEYQGCVAAKACAPSEAEGAPNQPMVKVSWRDAETYAAWLSARTGLRFRLPRDWEWAYAAGSRFFDDALPDGSALADPGRRALLRYDTEAAAAEELGKAPQPTGSFGANEKGLVDLAGNVWEWTSSCFVRASLMSDDTLEDETANCGVRVVEGRHRAYVPDFIRDARAGGCSAGRPPSNLGFRLLREPVSEVARGRGMGIRAAADRRRALPQGL